MTFERFCADELARERAYIVRERARYTELALYCSEYEDAARALNLQPLRSGEITDRLSALTRREITVADRFRDNAEMRERFEFETTRGDAGS